MKAALLAFPSLSARCSTPDAELAPVYPAEGGYRTLGGCSSPLLKFNGIRAANDKEMIMPPLTTFLLLLVASLFLNLGGCGDTATLPVQAGMGKDPALPPPHHTWLPTIHIATAKGWPQGGKPTPAKGLQVNAYAMGLDHPRWLYVLPNGDVLVAETNAPPKPEDRKGVRGWVMKKVMARAGAGTPSANRITLLRDRDGDGVAETKSVFLQGLHSPFGMVLVGNDLYVANSDSIMRFHYTPDATQITDAGQKIADLPAGPINHHWTKNVIASQDGKRLYVTVGSNSNVAENGMAAEENRAAILEVDLTTGNSRVF